MCFVSTYRKSNAHFSCLVQNSDSPGAKWPFFYLSSQLLLCSFFETIEDRLLARYPEFGSLCASSGFEPNIAAETGGLGGGLGATPAEPRSKRRKKAPSELDHLFCNHGAIMERDSFNF